MRSRTKRALTWVALLVLAVLIGIVLAAYLMLAWAVPPTDGYIRTAGVTDSVAITFDAMGIPQVWAEDERDACFALGYQHAADRLFQMDLTRRLAAGRLSEMLGGVTLMMDKQQRMVGHARLATEALPGLVPADRDHLQAYCDGVNFYAESCRALPFEYHLLPVSFESWTIRDCLTILSFQTWFSNALMSSDASRLRHTEQWPEDKTELLIDIYPPWAPSIVPEDPSPEALESSDVLGTFPPTFSMSAELEPVGTGSGYFQRMLANDLIENYHLAFRMSTASNAWVVGPSRSASGEAMLAADPHLEITRLPQFWYAVGLHESESGMNVLGISAPGLPFVIMGHNGAAGWAFTVSGVDVIDYYREQLDPQDSTCYLTPDGYQPLRLVVDTIVVAGQAEPTILTTRWTEHGPLNNDSDNLDSLYSLRWVGFKTHLAGAVGAAFDLHRIDSFDSFRRAVTNMGAFDASWMYADSSGNIGYQLGTPVALRSAQVAALPHDGWIRENQWQGFLPLDQTPHALNLDRGWLASCNNLPSREHDLPGHYFYSRATRLQALLEKREKFSPDNLRLMQCDLVDSNLSRWKELLAEGLIEAGEPELAGEVLTWSGAFHEVNKPAVLMARFYYGLRKIVSHQVLDGADGLIPPGQFDRLMLAERSSSDLDWDDPEAIVDAARAAADFANGRTWGEVLSLKMSHPMGSIPVLSNLLGLNRGPWPWHGSAGTIDAAFYRELSDSTYGVIVGPSWRFVIDFADIDAATMVLPAGNSGHPTSEHFFDFFDMWRDGESWNVPFSRDRVMDRAVSTLVLMPGEDD